MYNPDSTAFTVAGFPIKWYGILITIGVLLAVFLAIRSGKKYGWSEDDITDAALIGIPLGVIGARLYFVIFFDLPYYLSHPLEILMTWKGGLAVYGGIIGGCLAAVIYCKWKKRSLLELLDIAVPSIALGQAIGRWGNFFNQEAFGGQITNPAWMWFPFAVRIDATNTVHYATFFYESLWCALIAVVLLTQRKRFKHSGDVLLGYALMYSFERMLVESLRTDSLMIGPLRVSQLLSGLLFFGTLAFVVVRYVSERGKPVVITNKLHPLYAAPTETAEASEDDTPEAGDGESGTVLPFEDEEDLPERAIVVEETRVGENEAPEEAIVSLEDEADAPDDKD